MVSGIVFLVAHAYRDEDEEGFGPAPIPSTTGS